MGVVLLGIRCPMVMVKVRFCTVAEVSDKEITAVFGVEQKDMADIRLTPAGQQCDPQCVLVIIEDQPSFQCVADGFPTLVVLVENVTALHVAVFVNDQQGLFQMGENTAALFVVIQQPPDGVRQPGGRLVAAVGQQGVQPNVQPAVKQIHGTGHRDSRQLGPGPVVPQTGHMAFTQLPQFQGGLLKELHGPLQ